MTRRRLTAEAKAAAAKFCAAAEKLFPDISPRAMLCRPHFLGVDHHTVTRMMDGRQQVTKRVEWAMYGLRMCKKHEPETWADLMAMPPAKQE